MGNGSTDEARESACAYTPTTSEVRRIYVNRPQGQMGSWLPSDDGAEFDRWLETVKAEARGAEGQR